MVRLFTDDDFQRYKVTKGKNPIVKSFWVHQMAKTEAIFGGEFNFEKMNFIERMLVKKIAKKIGTPPARGIIP